MKRLALIVVALALIAILGPTAAWGRAWHRTSLPAVPGKVVRWTSPMKLGPRDYFVHEVRVDGRGIPQPASLPCNAAEAGGGVVVTVNVCGSKAVPARVTVTSIDGRPHRVKLVWAVVR